MGRDYLSAVDDLEAIREETSKLIMAPACVRCGERPMALPHSYCRACVEERRLSKLAHPSNGA